MKRVIGLLLCVCLLSFFFVSCANNTNNISEIVSTTEPNTSENLNGYWIAYNPNSKLYIDTVGFIISDNKCTWYMGYQGELFVDKPIEDCSLEKIGINQYKITPGNGTITLNGDMFTYDGDYALMGQFGTYHRTDKPSLD